MTICAVIDSNNQQINLIVAEPTDVPPEGCTLVEIPPGMFWDGNQISVMPVVPEE